MKTVVAPEEVRKQLDRVLRSHGFAGTVKLQGFLRYVVEQTLAGRTGEIKESVIGLEVYNKSATYDPRYDSTVRAEAAKLRSRLDHYYDHDGENDPIRISVPKGSYIPHFEWRDSPVQEPFRPLAEAPVPGEQSTLEATRAARSRRWRLVGVLFLAGALFGLAIGWSIFARGSGGAGLSGSEQAIRLTQLTDIRSFSSDPVLSPDGSTLYYSSDRQSSGMPGLWRRSLRDDARQAVRLSEPSFTARMPSVSPDGRRVAFRLEDSGGVLAVLSADGGQVSRLPTARRGRNPRFSPQGNRLAYWVPRDDQTLENGSVFVLNLDNLDAGSIHLFAEFAHAAQPVWSETGDHVLVIGTWESGNPDLEYDAWTVAMTGGRPSGRPVKSQLFPALAARGFFRNVAERGRVEISDWRDGWLYMSLPVGDGAGIYRMRLEPGQPFAGGPVQQISGGAGRYSGARAGTQGRVVYSNAMLSYDLHSAPLSGAGPITRLTNEPGVNLRASVDRLGKRAAWEQRHGTGSNQLWFGELESAAGRLLGAGLRPERTHVLVSPDGSQAAYLVLESGKQSLYLEGFASGSPPRRICEDCGIATDWTASGSHLLYVTGQQPSGIGLLEVATGKRRPLLNHPSYSLYGARFQVSAQGNGWLALYADNGPRTRQVFLAPVTSFQPAPYQQWVALTDGAHWDLSPAWGDGPGVVYFVSERDGHRCIWKRAFDALHYLPKGDPQPVYHFHSPDQSLMRSVSNRGADALWVAGGRLYFSLDNLTSSVWMLE